MDDFKVGEKIFWRDPENKTSGVYEVYKTCDEYTYLIGNGASEVEAYAGEMYELSQKVSFRKWAVTGTLIALFPEQELDDSPDVVVASYQSGVMEREAEYDFVMDATVPANKDKYQALLEELKKEGYDALEIISEPPVNLCELLCMMDRIAQKLIASIYISDFTIHDRQQVSENNAQKPFVWQVRNSGTWLYFLDEPDWKKRLLERMDAFKCISKENLYYLFDGKDFYPVFEQTILKMASE
jgi:hypothetical protein